MKLASNWREVPKHISTWCLAGAAAIQGAWTQLPPDMQASVPDQYVTYATIAVGVLGFVAKFIDQGLDG